MTFALELSSCDGSNSVIVISSQCTIPLSTLTAIPFNLKLGDSVNVKIIASNAYGDSVISAVENGAIIVLVPDAPLTLADSPGVTL